MKRFQGSTFDGFSRRKLIEDRDIILELTAKIQELQNEVNCMSDSRDFQDVMSESQTPVQDQRCQSGPSARNSFVPSEGRFFKELCCRPKTTADFRSSF